MNVRRADFDTDAPGIIEGARAFSESTQLASWFRSGDDFVEDIAKIMALDNVDVFVAEHEGKIVGGVGIVYVPFVWNQSILCGEELFWWVYPDAPFGTGRGLFDQAMKEIGAKGARPMFRSLTTSPGHIERFYERRGLRKLESIYARVD